MDTGVGFSEILLVVTLILIFFGSKEIPQLLRTIVKILAKFRYYTDQVKVEIGNATRSIDVTTDNGPTPSDKRMLVRKKFVAIRKKINIKERKEKSEEIFKLLQGLPLFNAAESVLIYASAGSEVETNAIIREMLKSGKRVVLPQGFDFIGKLKISEIKDFEKDLVTGPHNVPEPCAGLGKEFFRSDLQLVVCPGIAFNNFGGRLSRERSGYDQLIKELKGIVPLLGIAFDQQISEEQWPHDYRDIEMDQVITESGLLLAPEAVELKTLTDSGEQLPGRNFNRTDSTNFCYNLYGKSTFLYHSAYK